MDRAVMKGHLEALLTILIWGTTFISTKVLLDVFSPVEILLQRFILGYAALWIVCPHILRFHSWREEGLFAAAGLSGITLYYLLENIALTSTSASNVGVIIAVSPFFVALLSRGRTLTPRFFLGFAAAITGIAMISFSGSSIELDPSGDLLALAAAFVWAVYSVLTERISSYGYDTLQTTRRIFMYGIMFMVPVVLLMGFSVSIGDIAEPGNLLNILYLGLGASALCFVTWNSAVRILGSVLTSVYIYLVPVVTVIFSALILAERMDALSAAGAVLTLSGLVLSQCGR